MGVCNWTESLPLDYHGQDGGASAASNTCSRKNSREGQKSPHQELEEKSQTPNVPCRE
jgi:hypothetical protein